MMNSDSERFEEVNSRQASNAVLKEPTTCDVGAVDVVDSIQQSLQSVYFCYSPSPLHLDL